MSKHPITRSVVHPDSKLRKASDYLEFDIHSLAAAIELYIPNKGTETGNAALDSLLLRTRLLIDFFMRTKARPDDVIALDFFHDYNQKPYKPRRTKIVDREYEKINKWLMHLTTKPMPTLRSNQRYRISRVVPSIICAFKKWLLVVPDNRIYKPVKVARNKYEKHLERIDRLLSPPLSSSQPLKNERGDSI